VRNCSDTRSPHSGRSVDELVDSVISYFCAQFAPCELLERAETTLGGEAGERFALQYTDGGQQWVRFSTYANHDVWYYNVRLSTPLSDFPDYRGDAQTIMTSFEFLDSVP
jgi:hypothetical protein